MRRESTPISDPEQGPTEDGKSLAPGNATANSYLIIGEEVVLLDLAVYSPELKTYAEKLAGKPVQLVLSHTLGTTTMRFI